MIHAVLARFIAAISNEPVQSAISTYTGGQVMEFTETQQLAILKQKAQQTREILGTFAIALARYTGLTLIIPREALMQAQAVYGFQNINFGSSDPVKLTWKEEARSFADRSGIDRVHQGYFASEQMNPLPAVLVSSAIDCANEDDLQDELFEALFD